MDKDQSKSLQDRLLQAIGDKTPVAIKGRGSKGFYGDPVMGEALPVADHCGILNYEPKELVMTARAGTLLRDIEAVLAENNQMLAFEPPYYGADATLGGTIACGFSGPNRAYSGSARDYVLGARIINGKAQILRFGGEVMKNVAGYDISRLMVGARGTLGLLLDISLKTLPRPEAQASYVMDCDQQSALDKMNQLACGKLPISASAYGDGRLRVRFSGIKRAIGDLQNSLGMDLMNGDDAAEFWHGLKEHKTPFFDQNKSPLWRISLPQTAPAMFETSDQIIEWGGALRWIKTDLEADKIYDLANQAGGHACLFYKHKPLNHSVFHPQSTAHQMLARRIKYAFDPDQILNRSLIEKA